MLSPIGDNLHLHLRLAAAPPMLYEQRNLFRGRLVKIAMERARARIGCRLAAAGTRVNTYECNYFRKHAFDAASRNVVCVGAADTPKQESLERIRKQRLEEHPDDAKGWLLLAKSYDHVGRPEDAAAAYDKARELGLSDGVPEARRN